MNGVRIDSKFNLVVEVETDNGTIFVHSTPIAYEVYKKYFLVLSKTFSKMIAEGLSFVAGPRVASLLLEQIATEDGKWDGRDGVRNGLVAEIVRLSNAIMPSENGWTTFPFQDVIDKKLMSFDDIEEVMALLTFFTLICTICRKNERQTILEKMKIWGGLVTSQNVMEFVDSLRTSTEEEISLSLEKT
jgi:hypothetical protein